MKQHTKTSLIISTYNRPEALLICLNSILHQTVKPDEIIIGDDGSTQETKRLIDKMKEIFAIPIIHVWQEDNGFQLAKVRNKSVAASNGEYIIEIDGDVFLSRHFIEDHLKLAQPGKYVKGGRVNLNEKLTKKICEKGVAKQIRFWTKGIEAKRENAVRFKLLSLYLASRYRRYASPALGCNMSFWKDDYIKINGYDESYVGWGCEDQDFGNRLQRLGLKKSYLKFAGIVYHLWHEDKHMYNLDNNKKYEKEQNEKGAIRCEKGIDQYL